MASKIQGDNSEPIADINIVPFVDIILVVLIIFMITTPFIVKPSININLPKAASGEDTTPSQLTVTIGADGKAMLNGKPATDDDITAFSKDAIAKKPDTQAIIWSQIGSLPRADIERIAWRNAAELFRHPVPAELQADPNAI